MKITQPSRRAGRAPARGGGSPARSLPAPSSPASLVAWDDLHNHAALVAAAAAPQPKGVHETVGSILATGGIFTALVVAAVVFGVATVLTRRRNARPAAPLYPAVAPRRRRRASARW